MAQTSIPAGTQDPFDDLDRSTTQPGQDTYDATQAPNGEHPLVETGRQAADTAGQLAERATNIGFTQIDRGREQAANGLDKLVDTIRRVSLDMQAEQPGIAGAAETVADRGEKIAEYLRTTDARGMLRTVEDTARRQPLLFLGGAFALGVVVSRLVKAAGGGVEGSPANGSRPGGQNLAGRYQPAGATTGLNESI